MILNTRDITLSYAAPLGQLRLRPTPINAPLTQRISWMRHGDECIQLIGWSKQFRHVPTICVISHFVKVGSIARLRRRNSPNLAYGYEVDGQLEVARLAFETLLNKSEEPDVALDAINELIRSPPEAARVQTLFNQTSDSVSSTAPDFVRPHR
jgi:hypothetical protein